MTDYFFNSDELYHDANDYEVAPEIALCTKETFGQLSDEQKAPEVMFMSHQGPNELAPTPCDIPMVYQDIHYPLEKWAIFRMLPQMLKFDRALTDWITNVEKGTLITPSYDKERNQPSLWTYYETLPQWARDSPIVRQTLYAFEYHKPHMDIRQKEMGLNFAASMLRPIEGRYRKVITEVAESNKLRVTIEGGKAMMQELNFYTIDVADLGSDTEDDGGDDAAEKEMNRLLLSGGIDEEEAAQANIMERVMKQISNTDHEEERRKIYDEEMSI